MLDLPWKDAPGREIIQSQITLIRIPETDAELEEILRSLKTTIKVIGCGGGGSNSIQRMMGEGIQGADLVAINTDAQHLLHIRSGKKVLIEEKETRGLGAGSLPNRRRRCNREYR